MKIGKHAALLGLSGVMLTAAPMTALAGSPEFARSAEEWEQLRDNVLEYEEIAGLIHEYNATVQKDSIDYAEFRREYGNTNDEVADKYRELADELLSVDYPDIDDANYGAVMAQIIGNEQSAKQYRQTADDALEDSYVKYMTNCLTEANLVASAQTEMINYYINQLQLQIAERSGELQQDAYQAAVNRQSVGMATEVEVLTALESLHTSDQTIQNSRTAIDTGRQKLLVMLGWKADDTPEIREIPAVDLGRIAALNPDADKADALANSYTQLINLRQLENAKSADKRETLQTTVAETERSIYATLYASYQSVLAAKTSYDLAVAQYNLEQQNQQVADRKVATGEMAQMEYRTQTNTTEISRLKVEVAELNLFQAIQTYDWKVNGLAGA